MGIISRPDTLSLLEKAASERILVLDGAMGTSIQGLGLEEADFRGARFADHPCDLKGNNDLLVLTQPEQIKAIHDSFLEAGADIITTNTFNANAISLADYQMQPLAREMNRQAAEIANSIADEWTALTPLKPRFVAGALGPTNRTASLSPDVTNPAYRAVTFDQLVEAYRDAALGLVEGGVDILLVETVFDTLNAKAALYAVEQVFDEIARRLPVIVSGTITDRSGRTLTGQTPGAFWHSIEHAAPFAVGFNCALGAADLRAHVAEIARLADTRICAYPNAGLPNALGGYDEMPDETAGALGEWAESGLVNFVGGCCGTTPEHIRAIARAVDGVTPRTPPERVPGLKLSGLEAFEARAV